MDPIGVIKQQFSVPFAYEVAFTRGVFDPGNDALLEALTRLEPGRRQRALVVVDGGLAAAQPGLVGTIEKYFRSHAARLELVAPPAIIPGGEASKNDGTVVDRLHRLINVHHIDRQSFVVIVGGGAVLDVAGYAASTAHRGVRTIRVPTTVLSQNDSGVGVKNAINAFGSKNYLGTFHPPHAVINDFQLLRTLHRRDVIAGYAEAIKVALIRDATFFDWMEANATALAALNWNAVAHLVRRCAELHLQHIAGSGDPFERGSAKPLDFGHWSAHRLESITQHDLRHGEAVALGMLLDCRYALLAGIQSEATFRRIEGLVQAVGLPTWHEALLSGDDTGKRLVLRGLDEFREHLGGELTVTMVQDPGRPKDVNEMDQALILDAIEAMRAQAEELAHPQRDAVGT